MTDMLPNGLSRRIIRVCIGLAVLSFASLASYELTHFPQPINVETKDGFSPAVIKLGQEEFVIEGPVVTESILFSDNGRPEETVEVIFERATLDKQTLKILESLALKPPATLTSIAYWAKESKTDRATQEECRTQVKLLEASSVPAEIAIRQLGDPGKDNYRHFEMRVKGSELVSSMLTMPPGDSASGPGCLYSLSVGPDWNKAITRTQVRVNVAEDSTIRFYFRPLKPNPSPWADLNGFLQLDLGAQKLKPSDPPPFQARAIKVRRLGDNSTLADRLSARSLDGGPPLTISDLRIGSDQIQLTIVGKASVAVDGVEHTTNLAEDAIASALLIAANVALWAWVARFVFKAPSARSSPKDD